jgi:SpoVK/Ycf46/Vps4 family AAA+-type ATPase
MNQLIGIVPFKVAEEEEFSEGSLSFTIDTNTQELKAEEKELPKITFEEATAQLNALIGLGAVKKQIDEFSTYLKFLRIRKEKGFKEDNKFNLHTVFTGNPGTGKTTVAKMLGDIYYSLGLLSKGDVYEVGRVDLVGEYIGQTAPKVKKAIDKARGGILFVDEAYALSDRGEDGKDLGKEVIEVLIKEMSDGPGDIAIVFAGYPKQMKKFVERNPGMASRISSSIHFPDYVPDELMEIAVYAAKQRDVFFHLDAQAFLYKKIVEAYRTRTDNFGNARFINAVVEECKQTMALRLMRAENFDKMSKTDMATISLGDVEKSFGGSNVKQVHIPIDEAMLDEALKELHEMVGLEQVKRDIDEMAKLVRYYTEIGRDVKKAFSMHTVFTGNPGTGKTTVARVIVKIYKALGILEQGHLVECDRKELVAGYIGQTAIKTAEMIDKAIGGGLFIDEAYSLNTGASNDFGREAVDTLLKRMEDQRGEFIVIAAGYPNEMKAFLELNPGLMSRFDRTLHFEDFSQKELFHIALTMFDKENLFLNDIACDYLKSHISKLVQHKHKYFGNARTIRKVVQEVARRQNLRLALMAADMRTPEMIKTVTIEDFGDLQLIEQDKREERKGIGFSFGNS